MTALIITQLHKKGKLYRNCKISIFADLLVFLMKLDMVMYSSEMGAKSHFYVRNSLLTPPPSYAISFEKVFGGVSLKSNVPLEITLFVVSSRRLRWTNITWSPTLAFSKQYWLMSVSNAGTESLKELINRNSVRQKKLVTQSFKTNKAELLQKSLSAQTGSVKAQACLNSCAWPGSIWYQSREQADKVLLLS